MSIKDFHDGEWFDRLLRLTQDCEAGRERPSALRCRWKELAAEMGDAPELDPLAAELELDGDPPLSPSAAFHAECLSTLDWSRSADYRVPLKVVYHLRMLCRLHRPNDPTLEPLVSIVIAANETATVEDVRRSIESALRQTYGRLEIFAPTGLAPSEFDDERIRVLADSKRGLAHGRNLGLAAARGVFVQFLDAGDELEPHATALKAAAFRRAGDARLCCHPWEGSGSDSMTAATQDPLLAVCRRYPFIGGAMFAPRWLLRQVGGFEEDLGPLADARFWFRAACKSPKVVALRENLLRRGASAPIEKEASDARLRLGVEADLRSAMELTSHYRKFRYFAPLVGRLTWLWEAAVGSGFAPEEIDALHERIVALEADAGRGEGAPEGATALVIDQLLWMLREKQARPGATDRPTFGYLRDRECRLLDRLTRFGRVTGADLRRWLPELPPQPFRLLAASERQTLVHAFEQLQSSVFGGDVEVSLRALVRVGADYPAHPFEDDWNGANRLGKVLGETAAKRLVGRKLLGSSWRWLGRALVRAAG